MSTDTLSLHDSVYAFADGELSAEEADAFRAHLGTCAECQLELSDILQLQALGERLAGEEVQPVAAPELVSVPAPALATAPAPAQVPASATTLSTGPTPAPRAFRPSWNRRRATLGMALGGALAAAFSFAVLRTPSQPDPVSAEALALAPTRSLEARLSYGGASGWRPYGVKRSGGERPQEKVPLQTLANMEEADDMHGLAVAALLNGEREQATDYLRRAPGLPDLDCDRAALALARGAPAEALALVEAVLKTHPSHPQALWNQGLALRELGLELLAARSFKLVAALGEPGWSDEARERQRALEAQVHERQRAWETAREAGRALVTQGTPIPEEMVRHAPSVARDALYLAAASAPTLERVQALLPLAQALDGHYGGGVLQRHIDRTTRRDFARRGPLAATLAKLSSGALTGGPEAETSLQRARTSGDADLVLEALPLLRQLPAKLQEYEAAAALLGDPWFLLDAQLRRIRARADSGERESVEPALVAALRTCDEQRLDVRCVELESAWAALLLDQGRDTEALEHLQRAWDLARRGNDVEQEALLLPQLARAHSQEPALARAFTREAALRGKNSE
ncbi:zf-HC2 domain-containing protein [Myxococcaceae bacterium GXIMD 01537]